MSQLPSPFDVDQLRRQAKELRALAQAGDRAARERIRLAHPRYGRDRLTDDDLATFTLRDAQLCLARELGFDGWRDVLAHAHGSRDVGRPWRRWPNVPDDDLPQRAARVSAEANHGHVGPEHALGAMLRAGTGSSVVRDVLDELGATWEGWLGVYGTTAQSDPQQGRTFNPAWYRLLGFAEGLALADGWDRVADDHVLLALAYGRTSRHSDCLVDAGVDPDEVVLALARRGVAVSDLRPPARAPEPAPQGPRVHFPAEEYSNVTRALVKRFPPGAGNWGWNTDGKGRLWVDGDADLHLDEVVRSVITDPSLVTLQPFDEAIEEDDRRRKEVRSPGG